MTEPANFKELLQSHAKKWPRVTSHWEGIRDRLKMTAHREGASIGGDLSNRVFAAEGDAASELPKSASRTTCLAAHYNFLLSRQEMRSEALGVALLVAILFALLVGIEFVVKKGARQSEVLRP